MSVLDFFFGINVLENPRRYSIFIAITGFFYLIKIHKTEHRFLCKKTEH